MTKYTAKIYKCYTREYIRGLHVNNPAIKAVSKTGTRTIQATAIKGCDWRISKGIGVGVKVDIAVGIEVGDKVGIEVGVEVGIKQ